uniref:BZIP domain-containing protein n=1 Tax=Salix viminalis TaxID=40686 RepID=A0A6N2KGS9_SALVM
MLNRKRSYSASFFDMGVNSLPRVPFLPRSARDSFAFLKEPCFVKSGNESCTVAEQQNVTQCRSRHNNALDSELKSKRIKRTVSNRLYAQRSRLRKLLYVEKLERSVKAEEARVSWLSLQEPVYQQYQMALKIENNRMKEILGGLEREKAMKQAEFQYLKKELQALRGASMSLLFY